MTEILTWREYTEIMGGDAENEPNWYAKDHLLATSTILNEIAKHNRFIFPVDNSDLNLLYEPYQTKVKAAIAYQIYWTYYNEQSVEMGHITNRTSAQTANSETAQNFYDFNRAINTVCDVSRKLLHFGDGTTWLTKRMDTKLKREDYYMASHQDEYIKRSEFEAKVLELLNKINENVGEVISDNLEVTEE